MKAILLKKGDRFGRLVIVKRDTLNNGVRKWVCRCDCGTKEHKVTASLLKRGNTKSCGCLQKETAADTCRRTKKTHGMVGTPEFRAWCQMRDRCTNSKYWAFNRYGGRGISVSPRWLGKEGFANFYEDVGPRPSSSHSLDRYPNKDGNYEPGNCRWATSTEQNNNKVNNRLITHLGQTQTVRQWEKLLNIPEGSLQSRLTRGWTESRAMTQPYRKVHQAPKKK